MFNARLGFNDSAATCQLQVTKIKYDISENVPIQFWTGP
jgi:hypothetical protein